MRLSVAKHGFVVSFALCMAPNGIVWCLLMKLCSLLHCRENGVTQTQLGKEFGMDGKDTFYIVKNLESRGLIVRQSATLRRKESGGEGESKCSLPITTNNMYLYRYAKTLGSQQKLEITTEERAENTGSTIESLISGDEDLVKEDVTVKDYLPAMKAVYDMLEAEESKVCCFLSSIK